MRQGTPVDRGETSVDEARVLAIVRGLAREVGGERAERAVAPAASLEREIGLGSLERVELLLRLEAAFGAILGESFLALDTPREIAQALAGRSGAETAQRDQPAAPGARTVAVPVSAAVTTLPRALLHHAQATPERVHVWLPDEELPEHRALSYGRLLDEAQHVAGGLRASGVRPGETVALMLPTGLDFLASFLGIQIAGAIPVPLYPPLRLERLEEHVQRQSVILRNAGATLMIAPPSALPLTGWFARAAPALRAVVTVADLRAYGAMLPATAGETGDTALIQYTSGSTGDPKGVELTHSQLLANIRALAAHIALAPDDVTVSWLPLYHDMGLIGAWLSSLYHAVPLVLLSPLAFLARPERWLTTIHAHRATLSAAPNFAYELCARKVSEATIDGLDLSCWRCALNGAEPVNPDTLARFVRRFSRAGFKPASFLPVYGLAESAVALCFPPLGRGALVDAVDRRAFEERGRAEPASAGESGALRFVSVGRPLAGYEVRLIDPRGADLPERGVGRLVFRGPSAMVGYFRRREATAAITLPGGWLDTGDLAYRAHDEIYIAGRAKDLIIKGGRNLVPQEIEDAAASIEGVRRGCVVAFGVASEALGTERLVLVAETRVRGAAEREALRAAVAERVAEMVGVPPDAVELAAPHSVSKTSSGKVRRSATRELYLAGRLGRRPATLVTRLRLALLSAAHALRPLRHLVRVPYAIYFVLGALALLACIWPAALLLPGRRAAWALTRWASRALLRLSGCRLSCEGIEHLRDLNGPLVLACNHASYVDAPALLALLPRAASIVAKREVFGWPLIGTLARKGGHVAVERWDTQKSIADAERIAALLRDGAALLFFPEGTFTAAVGLRPFRLGAFKAAAEAGCAIVPLALSGTRGVLRGDSWLPRPGRIRLWIGAPIAVNEGGSFRDLVDLRDRVADVIAAHCDEPRLDLVVAGLPPPPAR